MVRSRVLRPSPALDGGGGGVSGSLRVDVRIRWYGPAVDASRALQELGRPQRSVLAPAGVWEVAEVDVFALLEWGMAYAPLASICSPAWVAEWIDLLLERSGGDG